jgi:hypothetical protein
MDSSGISFNEACEATPYALTEQQLKHCPGHHTTPAYLPLGIGIVLLIAGVAIMSLAFKKKRSK